MSALPSARNRKPLILPSGAREGTAKPLDGPNWPPQRLPALYGPENASRTPLIANCDLAACAPWKGCGFLFVMRLTRVATSDTRCSLFVLI